VQNTYTALGFYTYDANGSMTATTGPDARTVTYTTDDQAQIIAP
jgi:hypothetical protein